VAGDQKYQCGELRARYWLGHQALDCDSKTIQSTRPLGLCLVLPKIQLREKLVAKGGTNVFAEKEKTEERERYRTERQMASKITIGSALGDTRAGHLLAATANELVTARFNKMPRTNEMT